MSHFCYHACQRSKKNSYSSFHEANKDDLIMAATNLFGYIIKIHTLRKETENMSLDINLCYDGNEMQSISSSFKLSS